MYIAFDSYEFYYQTFDKRIDRLFLHEYDSFYYLHNLANYIYNAYDYCNSIQSIISFAQINSM